MSVSFYPYVLNGPCWDFPAEVRAKMGAELVPPPGSPAYRAWLESDETAPNPDYDPRLDVNLANRNARLVLIELGWGDDIEDCTPVPIGVFSLAVAATLARLGGQPEPGIAASRDQQPGGPVVIDLGTPDGYLNGALTRLGQLAEAAAQYGASHIGWG